MINTPAAEVIVDEKLAGSLLREQHPDLVHLPISLLDTGWDNYIFQLGDDMLLRFPRRSIAVPLLHHEQKWLPQLTASLPIPIPAPIRIGKPAGTYPWPWSIIPFLAGNTADQVAPAAHQAERFGAFLKALHQKAPADAPQNELRGVPLQQRAELVEQCIKNLESKTDLISPAHRSVWEEALAAPVYREARWLHGDLHARNVIVKDGVINGIIDWGDLTSGDVATDLAAVWMLFSSPLARARVLETYGVAEANMIRRAKGWAVFFWVILAENGLEHDEQHWLMGARTLANLLT
ncbi:MAG: aminoglycoside phosphotransferase family protein [Saprospiraceae bacterium]|nr:aminoglycoside phosphotransferase family protein [Lewinella sp.]